MLDLAAIIGWTAPCVKSFFIGKALGKIVDKANSISDDVTHRISVSYYSLCKKYSSNDGQKFHFCDSQLMVDAVGKQFFDPNFDVEVLIIELRKNDNIKDFRDQEINQFFIELTDVYKKDIILKDFLTLRYAISNNEMLHYLNNRIDFLLESHDKQNNYTILYEFLREHLATYKNLVTELKLTTAVKLLDSIENYIIDNIGYIDNTIYAEILYQKAICLSYQNMPLSNKYYLKAYDALQDKFNYNIYLKHMRVMFLEEKKQEALEEANRLIVRNPEEIEALFVKCVSDGNLRENISLIPEAIRNNHLFKNRLFNWIYAHPKEDDGVLQGFFILNSEPNPFNVTIDNISLWNYNLYIYFTEFLSKNGFSYYIFNEDVTRKCYDFVNVYWGFLNNTEIKDKYNIVNLIRCYTGYLLNYQDSHFANEYLSLPEEKQEWYYLFKANILCAKKDYEQLHNIFNVFPTSFYSCNVEMSLGLISNDESLVIEGVKKLVGICGDINNDILECLLPRIEYINIAENVKEVLLVAQYKNPSDKIFMECYLKDTCAEDYDIGELENIKNDISDAARSKAALMFAKKGMAESAAKYLEKSIDPNDVNYSLLDYLEVLRIGNVKKKEAFCLLKSLRERGIPLEDKFLNLEFILSNEIQDTENAFNVISILYDRHKDNEDAITQYLLFAFYNSKDDIINSLVPIVSKFNFEKQYSVCTVGNILITKGYYKEALDIVYKAAIDQRRIPERMFFFSISRVPQIWEYISNKPEVVEEGCFVEYSINNEGVIGKFVTQNSELRVLLGHQELETIEQVKFGDKIIFRIISIGNKYYGLCKEIYDGFSEKYSEYPVASFSLNDGNTIGLIEEMKRRLGEESEKQIKTHEEMIRKYETNENALFVLAINDLLYNTFKYVFSNFNINLKPLSINLMQLDNIGDFTGWKFVLDYTSLWFLSSLKNENVIDIHNKFVISKRMYDLVKEELIRKELEQPAVGHILVTTTSVNLTPATEEQHSFYIEALKKMLSWIEQNCEIEIVLEKLDYPIKAFEDRETNFTPLLDCILLASRPKYLLISDDSPLEYMISGLRQITTEAFFYHFTSKGEFITEEQIKLCYVGGNLKKEQILWCYDQLKRGYKYPYLACLRSLEKNDSLVYEAINAVYDIIIHSFDLIMARYSCTTIFTHILKGLDINAARKIEQVLLYGYPQIDKVSNSIVQDCFKSAKIIVFK